MKKFFLVALTVCALSTVFQNVKAQTSAIKIAVFDLDLMVKALPEYRNVDSLTAGYEQDSLAAQYQNYMGEYQRLDSTFKADSTAKRPQSVLDYSKNLKMQMGYTLAYWQQIAQQKSDDFRGQLAQPLYTRVIVAYKKVLATNKYALILKPNSYELGTHVDNLFPLVAKEMNITLPPGLTGDPNQAFDNIGSSPNAPQKSTGTAPAKKP